MDQKESTNLGLANEVLHGKVVMIKCWNFIVHVCKLCNKPRISVAACSDPQLLCILTAVSSRDPCHHKVYHEGCTCSESLTSLYHPEIDIVHHEYSIWSDIPTRYLLLINILYTTVYLTCFRILPAQNTEYPCYE